MRRAACQGNGHTRNALEVVARSPLPLAPSLTQSLVRARSINGRLPLTSPPALSFTTNMMLYWRTTSLAPSKGSLEAVLTHCSTFSCLMVLVCRGYSFIHLKQDLAIFRTCWYWPA